MIIQEQLYNLKMKILKSKEVGNEIKKELADNIFDIESSYRKRIEGENFIKVGKLIKANSHNKLCEDVDKAINPKKI